MEEADRNPLYNDAFNKLRSNPWFMLTYDENLVDEDLMAESESDEEVDEL